MKLFGIYLGAGFNFLIPLKRRYCSRWFSFIEISPSAWEVEGTLGFSYVDSCWDQLFPGELSFLIKALISFLSIFPTLVLGISSTM